MKIEKKIVLALKSVFPTFLLYQTLTGLKAKRVSVIEYILEILD